MLISNHIISHYYYYPKKMMEDISESQKQHLAQFQSNQTSGQQQQQQQQSSQLPSTQQAQQQSQQMSDSNGQMALTIRLLMQGKEVGSIIGKKGDNIKKFRENSGAKINVSDSSCPDRIVTLAGTLDEVYNAFSMICSKFEEQILQVNTGSGSIVNNNNSNNNSTSTSSPLSNTSTGINSILPTGTVTDPLFGLPSIRQLSIPIGGEIASSKEADMLTMNNNSTSTINNNNLSAPNKNLTSTTATNHNNNNNNNKVTNNNSNSNSYHPIVTLRLIIPASQCGSLIGRGGAKIKEIRELTGAAIQVAPDVLPNSTERVVTISGNVDSLKSCAYQICMIMVESPAKGFTIPYRPKPTLNPMLLAAATAGQAAAAYNLPGQFAISAHPDVNRLFVANNPLAAAFNPTAANLRAAAATGQAAAALSAVTSQSIGSHEMVIPNGLIGCVIGKGGSKINEIRQLSGATIKISNTEEGTKKRKVTINGAPEAINLAHYLITASFHN